MLKPSQPDFGYEDQLDFKENRKRRNSNWHLFLDCIQRYPKRERIHSLVDQMKNNHARDEKPKQKIKVMK